MKFEKSADTKILESILSEAKVGDTLTYESLSKSIGRDVRKFAWNALRSARAYVLRENKIVFSVEDNVGLVRLDDSQIVSSSESDRSRINRVAKRSLVKLSVVQFDKLDDAAKKKHVVYSAQMGALAMFANKASVSRIESNITNDAKTLAIGETLRLFTE